MAVFDRGAPTPDVGGPLHGAHAGGIEPGGRTSGTRLVGRLLESFFRRPLLCLLPLAVFTALGVVVAANTEREYESSAMVSVANQTLLADLTDMRFSEGFGWETPAAVTSRRIDELMGTDEFASTVADRAGLTPALESGTLLLDDIREAVSTSPAGANLVSIRASSPDPEHARALADSTYGAFVDWMVEGDVVQSAAAEEFFEGLLDRYERDVVEARSALEDFLADNPSGAAVRPAPQRAELDRLTTTLELAQDRYGTAVAGVQEAQLATEQTISDVAQRLRVVDAPQLPVSPESSRRDLAITLAMYVVIGLFFSGGLVVAGALLDRSFHTADDVRRRLGAAVVTVVPDAGARRRT